MFEIPEIRDSSSEGDDLMALHGKNSTLRKQLDRSERKVVLPVETIEKLHGLINPLIARTHTAAELLKTATKIKAGQDNLKDLAAMREFDDFVCLTTSVMAWWFGVPWSLW